MAIDINGINSNHSSNARSRGVENQQLRQKNDASMEKDESVVEKRGESVSFSNKAQSFQQIEAGLKDLPEVDSDKVAKIRAALESGSYEISAERVAQKMLNMEKDIF